MLNAILSFTRNVSLSLLSLFLLSSSASAALISFESLPAGTTVTSQYAGQGVSFSQGIAITFPDGNKSLQVSNPQVPYMELSFSLPVYTFSSRILELYLDLPPETEEERETPDAPPASDVKPDASVHPMLQFSDGTTATLEIIHALNGWQELAFTSLKPVKALQLNGHYDANTTPIYFVIDDVAFSNTIPAPEPGFLFLLLTGLPGAFLLRRKLR